MDLLRTSGFRRLLLATLTVTAANAMHPSTGEARVRHTGHKVSRTHLHSMSFNAVSHGHHGYFMPAHYTQWGHRSYSGAHVIQCVAFAKAESEVVIPGNARDWWYNAAGRYARGSAPESGSVLNFRPIRRMPLGHVAVVTGTVNSRVITIDQSHWGQNGISRNVRVVDVSPDNDWSAVRVELNGRRGSFGSIYPTFGFIYPRSEGAAPVMTASAERMTVSADGGASEVAEASENVGTIEEQYRAPRRAAHPLFRHSRHTVRHKQR
ncbi:CHAP domain-containing protein [Acetobacter conturbans]|uniref:CHAP domain-containing protein n=1 Tax=Acetobacter conturbans TaxID=1737472 RepID=A0ABX0K0H1_9PROT|nr:CHAP domain-containing protein [Acetobacter conturbans]NHN88609.1 CHAP domain-containing protein [Acetobacter conturbans]